MFEDYLSVKIEPLENFPLAICGTMQLILNCFCDDITLL